MSIHELTELLEKIKNVSIGIIGDFCLDAYLFLEPSASEISLETGLPTNAVKSQKYSLGGAGNVVNNLSAMGVKRIFIFGVIGDDPYGYEMKRILNSLKIDISGLLTQPQNWDTHVYVKPYQENQEQNRIDFGNFNIPSQETHSLLLQCLEQAIPQFDIMIINQQVQKGIYTEDFLNQLKEIIRRHPETSFITDSRHYSNEAEGTIRKINDYDGAALCGIERSPEDPVTFQEARSIAKELYERWQKPVFLTRHEYGCVVYDNEGYHEIPGLQILSQTDTVGAGDSMLAGISAALAAGENPVRAAEFGNFVSGVTVQKLFQTGTASPEEILNIGSDPDYRYRPELAFNPWQARYYNNTEIEIVNAIPQNLEITHAIFDHDGTISTLRQGWEEIMEPMMVRAIIGVDDNTIDEHIRNKVLKTVREYIDKTTGVQTLIQMQGLAELVRYFGYIPEEEILDAQGYKAIYNKELLKLVDQRLQKLNRGELDVWDFTLKNAVAFLKALYSRGVKLYLASGTDQQDVEKEAEALGYAKLFGGRIYGASANITTEPKKIVLEKILKGINEEDARQIVTFGDGPVEIRETHKRGGFTVGIASDEVRRFGLNLKKRSRLIQAGADLIMPDFSQMEHLLTVLF